MEISGKFSDLISSLVRGFASHTILVFIFPQQEMRKPFSLPKNTKIQNSNFTK